MRNHKPQQVLGKQCAQRGQPPSQVEEALDHPGQLTGDKLEPSHAQHFCWEVLAELMGTGTEIAVSNSAKAAGHWGLCWHSNVEAQSSTQHPNYSHEAKFGAHQQPVLVEKPLKRLDETENKPKPGTALNHILLFPLWGTGEDSLTCELQSSLLASSYFQPPLFNSPSP